jgi:hypothetical protein
MLAVDDESDRAKLSFTVLMTFDPSTLICQSASRGTDLSSVPREPFSPRFDGTRGRGSSVSYNIE